MHDSIYEQQSEEAPEREEDILEEFTQQMEEEAIEWSENETKVKNLQLYIDYLKENLNEIGVVYQTFEDYKR